MGKCYHVGQTNTARTQLVQVFGLFLLVRPDLRFLGDISGLFFFTALCSFGGNLVP